MTYATSLDRSLRSGRPLVQFRIGQHWLLSLLVGIAIVNIQDQGRGEPSLIGLAVVGFVLYGLLGWGLWRLARRLRTRLGTMPMLALYLIALAGLFMVATIAYLLIEHAYLVGGFALVWLPGGYDFLAPWNAGATAES